jgi:hypothetical protein
MAEFTINFITFGCPRRRQADRPVLYLLPLRRLKGTHRLILFGAVLNPQPGFEFRAVF